MFWLSVTPIGGIIAGSPLADLTIVDDDLTLRGNMMFEQAAYSVNEGDGSQVSPLL